MIELNLERIKSYFLDYIIRRMTEEGRKSQNQTALPERCMKWFKTNRKIRKQMDWHQLYVQMTQLIAPQIEINQLMVEDQFFNQCMQLLFSSFLFSQRKGGQRFCQHFTNDVFVILQGGVKMDEKEGIVYGPKAFLTLPTSRRQKMEIRTESQCFLFKVERKQLQKLKNDVLRRDREKKQAFLSQYLFCGLLPIFSLAAVRLQQVKEGDQLIADDRFLILREGLVGRRSGSKGGSQLTTGCLINIDKMALQLSIDSESNQTFLALQKCCFVSFQIEEFLRMIKVNSQLKNLLRKRVGTILEERKVLNDKCQHITQQFNEQFKLGTQMVRKHYSIQFKARPKTANPGRSFRKKNEMIEGHQSVGQFISFDRYDKMMVSKQRVAETKATFGGQKSNTRIIIPLDYHKKIKQQNKMFKLQSGKIQKLTQRQSSSDPSLMKQIRKNLCRVTHLFDEPLDPNISMQQSPKIQPQVQNKFKPRYSGIKPEQFLKQQYLTSFLRKSTVRNSLQDLQMVPLMNTKNKQNKIPRMNRSDGLAHCRRSQALHLRSNK